MKNRKEKQVENENEKEPSYCKVSVDYNDGTRVYGFSFDCSRPYHVVNGDARCEFHERDGHGNCKYRNTKDTACGCYVAQQKAFLKFAKAIQFEIDRRICDRRLAKS